MNELHLFAGAGGGILGGILLGHTCVCAVEIEQAARNFLFKRQRDGIMPMFPVWDNVTTFDGTPWRGKVDCVCGGFPCKQISAANTDGEGLDGADSGLFFQMARICGEVRPKFIFMENSPMLTVRGLDRVCGTLAEMGYGARWGTLGNNAFTRFGLVRERIWILAFSHEFYCERLQIQEGVNAEGRVREYPTSDYLSNVDPTRLVADGYAVRAVDDVAGTMDRIVAIGNGQVPVVAAFMFRTLMRGIEMKKFRTMEKVLADFPHNGKTLSAMRNGVVAPTHNPTADRRATAQEGTHE